MRLSPVTLSWISNHKSDTGVLEKLWTRAPIQYYPYKCRFLRNVNLHTVFQVRDLPLITKIVGNKTNADTHRGPSKL